MKKSLASKILLVIITTVAIMLLALLSTLEIYNKQIAKDNIATTIKMLENIILDENISTLYDYKRLVSLKNMGSDIRISILSADALAIADSFISNVEEVKLENQSNKPEILELKKPNREIGYSIRHSDTHDYSFVYGAKVLNIGDDSIILRVSTPLSYANRYMVGFSITIIIIITLLLLIPIVLFLPKFISNILSPFEMMKDNLNSILENNFRYTKSITKYDEINTVLEEINEVSHKLKANIEENQQEKDKLNYVLENINQGLIALDENAHIMFINSFALNLLNISDFGSKFLIEVIRDNSIELEIEKAIKDRSYISLEYSPTYSAGNTILKIEVVPLYERLHSLIKISDITELKKLEIEKNELFINASHKLNTPLTSILGYSELLLFNENKNRLTENNDSHNTSDTTETTAENSFISRINEQAKKMKELISNMLELTKYQKGSNLYSDSYNGSVDIKAISQEVANKMAIIAGSKNVCINIVAEESPLIFGNTKYIEDAIENLIDNAIKYNRENGSVDISIKSVGSKVLFTISDSGIGIAQEYINRVFERFFRVSNESTKNIEGSGIGLSIVKHVCLSCNANISIRSVENVGTDITIEFQIF